MGISKVEEFTGLQNEIALWAKALAHPARIAILQMLLRREQCICGELVDELPLSQSTVSQHLSELKKIGLIKGTINGAKTCYCLDEKAWKRCQKLFTRFLNADAPTVKNNCC
jgi:predicted transcriptional regulator